MKLAQGAFSQAGSLNEAIAWLVLVALRAVVKLSLGSFG